MDTGKMKEEKENRQYPKCVLEQPRNALVWTRLIELFELRFQTASFSYFLTGVFLLQNSILLHNEEFRNKAQINCTD
jgi:hypothetical protein